MKKLLALVTTMSLLMVLLAGCGSDSSNGGSGTSNGSGGSDDTGVAEESVSLRLAHTLNEQHTAHLALVEFARLVEERSEGSIDISIFPNGQLGSEDQVLEQLQAGSVAMTRVSAAALTSYAEGYNAFSLPYVFADADHFHKSMGSEAVQELYEDTYDRGFIGLTYYTSGARSFYTVDTPVLHPDDLRGLNIRVMDFRSQTDMMRALGGTPVGMAYSEIYTSLQAGVIDGAESNETALTNGLHGEVAKHFSYDEHTMIPDILVISSSIWDTLSENQQAILKEAAEESTEFHLPLWDEAIEEAVTIATEEMGVTFHEVEKGPFREAVAPMVEEYGNNYPDVKELLDAFKELE
ncbi:tripartite ATP-independent transporter DctP family solute receptor [Natranaerovirga hydrolytica]|uniref:Tripartite ATP-independent transporter DctP family solute receptor n=1 Tax=Natranaerovirga hydrolytica TaxID=680378 RepID=A0A4R1MSD0_9FIRM|nr:TRAP transporter substrate-binding protein [Natranaerovirga hydrolytica]TCK93489.1 tripartite ATP-independent transporter DctP family solute receptor [Natranaerovirga hydrolytica]